MFFYNMSKIKLFSFIVLVFALTTHAQTFKKGDKVVSLDGSLGLFDVGNEMKLGYGGRVAFEYGIADGLFGGKGAIGIGLVGADLYGGKSEGANTCTYDYTYESITYSREQSSSSARYTIVSRKGTHHREGNGASECDVKRNDATLMATVSLHFQFVDKLDTYLMVGGGATYRNYFFSNYHNSVGMEKVDHFRPSPTVGNYDGPVVSYSYDDFAHAKWEGADSKFYPAVCASIGARYYFTKNWAANVEVGLNTLTIKKEINAYTIGSIGACYRF